ncbi:MAG: MBL fold metallo-hydrolase [Chloroflexi bacterium]|nr:MBL fold metallo-hydrolase [Chloroflexota bacterium]
MFKVNYFGHSAFKITNKAGRVLVVDPYITKYAHSAATLDDVADANVVAVTHATHDHLGDAYEIIRRTGAMLVCPIDVEIDAHATGLPKEKVKRLTYGQTFREGTLTIRGLEAKHISGFKVGPRDYIAGQSLSFLIYPDADESTAIWYGGDTTIHSDLKMWGELYKPDIVIIGIGGSSNRENVDMTIEETALAVSWLHPKVVIPAHYPPGASDPQDFGAALKRVAPDIKVAALKPGDVFNWP